MRTIVRKTLTQVLKAESQLILWKYKPKVVAITGSVGKTSTKDAIYAVISRVAHVRKSEKSYNSQLGLPLTILGVPNGWNNPSIWLNNIWKGLVLIFTKKEYPNCFMAED
jgi:UDP-N-acetylmuramoyl-tripeptide--D-alanyl-D-alanine ligase